MEVMPMAAKRKCVFVGQETVTISALAGNPNVGEASEANLADSYSNVMKDADKLKLMLLAWNYQNSTAIQNGTEGPDLATMSALWAQYQNAMGLNITKPLEPNTNTPMRTGNEDTTMLESHDENNSSGAKEEDDISEDDSEDKLEQAPQDPERLKAFNMFVRLFVDENLDRMIPISKQPKEKIQAIIDSCTRQFPEFSERARKRIRTYLKSCRRNKRTRDGWENTTRPTPAHLTSVQAEQILAIACENESLNAKRMRLGLEPLGHNTDPTAIPLLGRRTPTEVDTVSIPTAANIAKISPISNVNNQGQVTTTNGHSTITLTPSNIVPVSQTTSVDISTPVNYVKSEIREPCREQQLPTTASNQQPTQSYPPIFTSPIVTNAPTDLSLKRPVFPHKLNPSEIAAVKQLITGYRESAAFLLRSADELEQLLLQQQ